MTQPQDAFLDLIRRVRAGDPCAAEELVRKYEPVIRVHVRTRLTSTSMCRLFESMDICQSVMASFFTRAALGQYDLAEPAQLVALLVRMARNKLADRAEQVGNHAALLPPHPDQQGALDAARDHEPGPEQIVAGQDLLAAVRKRLSPEEREVADRRGRGQPWEQIASEMGGTAQARRKELQRALNRVAAELGLGGGVDDE